MSTKPEPAQATAAGSQASPVPQHRLKRTRTGRLWVEIVCFAVILVFLLIFIVQNSETVDIAYLGAHVQLPVGVAMVLAAVGGVLLVVLAWAARISQLRAVARRHRRADARRVAAARVPDVPAG